MKCSTYCVKASFSVTTYPASILYKSIAGRYRPVSYPDGAITARYRFIKNAYWVGHAHGSWNKLVSGEGGLMQWTLFDIVLRFNFTVELGKFGFTV